MVEREKLSVEQAHSTCKSIVEKVRRKHDIESYLLDESVVKKIGDDLLFEREKHPKGSQITHYDLAHYLLTEHYVNSLKQGGLEKGDEKLVRQLLGRVYYNPPQRERERKISAARILLKRGILDKIVAALREEDGKLDKRKLMPEKARTDMFANPLVTPMKIHSKTWNQPLDWIKYMEEHPTEIQHGFYK